MGIINRLALARIPGLQVCQIISELQIFTPYSTLIGTSSRSASGASAVARTSSHTASAEQRVSRKRTHSPDSTQASETSRIKIRRIQEKNGRAKASDYDDTSQNLINLANGYYRALIATQDPFPDATEELNFLRLAWAFATTTAGLESGTAPSITPDVASVVRLNFVESLFY